MADIRINALAGTATSAASDDYLALDGAANGTRKILASNIAQNVSDVVLGTNGPSVKSSLDARAARQGLVFDGTAGTTVSIAAFGTSDFSCAFVASVNNFTNYNALVGNTANSGNFFFGTRSSAGDVGVLLTGGGSWISSGFTPTVGKNYSFVYTRSGTTGKFYVDGILISTVTDASNYTVGLNQFGANAGTANVWPGVIEQGLIYNRALSASEVVSLFEAGVPSGADYWTAATQPTSGGGAGTIVVNPNTSDPAKTTISGVTSTGFTATRVGGTGTSYVNFNLAGTFTFRKGNVLQGTFTISGLSGSWFLSDNNGLFQGLSAGTNTVNVTYSAAGVGALYVYTTDANAAFTVSNWAVALRGAILAPDAGQAGGGLTWYDTSGNAANITLPASGVSWNVPTSGKMATSLTIGGTGTGLTLSPTSGPATLAINGPGAGSAINYQLSGTNKYTAEYVSASDFFAIGRSGVAYDLALKNGNTLLGTTTDSSNGKLQLATHTTSAGGIGFGTDTSLFRSAAGNLQLSASVTSAAIAINNIGSGVTALAYDATGALVYSTGSLRFQTNSGTTALTLDSSQNATFAGAATIGATPIVIGGSTPNGSINVASDYGVVIRGKAGTAADFALTQGNGTIVASNVTGTTTLKLAGALRLGNAYTAGAVVSTGYVTIQDSTGTTYKVPVSL